MRYPPRQIALPRIGPRNRGAVQPRQTAEKRQTRDVALKLLALSINPVHLMKVHHAEPARTRGVVADQE
jgi:hypothetical protein